MRKIVLLDTSIASTNIGDKIIMNAVRREVNHIATDSFLTNIPTHESISKVSYRLLDESDAAIVGGTNLLSSKMNIHSQWKINLIDSWFISDVILMGVGWWQYQNRPNLYTRTLLQRVLSSSSFHSVRDEYTKDMLRKAGLGAILNTGCPTTWHLTESHCRQIPEDKAPRVVCTLTDYNKHRENDKKLLEILSSSYDEVFFWPQGGGDYEYVRSFGMEDIRIISPNLESYTETLKKNAKIDYVGTRLHAGIHALNHQVRTIILSIDNRAKEMSKDINLITVPRNNSIRIRNKINSSFETSINIPKNEIEKWRYSLKENLEKRCL